ncbi:MAG: TetR/AcrR family transcriptional regulator [Lachnospiraceae bacterium]|nr:TetR/AcrR family transcriptional regulator [Lachnospiraceae bacterium]
MGEKSVQKRSYIVEKARLVFQEKGYLTVTMKDIVEACDISRGGLYLYFDNLQDLFLEVLKSESEEADDVFMPAISESMSSADILGLFLQEQKKELLKKKGSLSRAIFEYNFQNKVPPKQNALRKQFDMAVKVIEKLIIGGVKEGDFICDDPRGTARNMMYVIEGLRISSQTIGITEETVNREILFLMKGIMNE